MQLHEKIDEAHSNLEAATVQQFDRLHFEWEGMAFQATTHVTEDETGTIELHARLGRLYYTIENRDERMMAIERTESTSRRTDGRFAITRQGDVSFQSLTSTDEQLKGKHFASALTVILLGCEQHLRAVRAHLKELDS